VSANAKEGVWHYVGLIIGRSITYRFHTHLYNSIGVIIFPAQWFYGFLRAPR
jgi:hypothetical protein